MEFTAFSLRPEVRQALEAKGFTTATPIQAAAIPIALEGRDVLGQARTGTGKTLAFGLPIANRLEPSRERGRAPRAFILTPTRELALQVAKELGWLAPHLSVTPIYGGTGYGRQAEALKRGTDIVVATPGRAIDYLEQGILRLESIEIAVLDEADEMLSMGFEEDVEQLLEATPPTRQTLLFSATVPAWAKRLSERFQRNHTHVNVVKDEAISYEELALQAPLQSRLSTLSDLLYAYGPERTIVFTNTKAEANELALGLEARGHSAAPIHGDLGQLDRERVMDGFRRGTTGVLVATDVAARGIDIPEVDLVVHYRLPDQNEAYLHRSGRTGRAGRSGRVVLLYGPRERRDLEVLEREIRRSFRRINPPTPEEVMEARWNGLTRRLANQPTADRNLWREYASRLLAEDGVEAIAGMLALILGGAPTPKSLITGEEGWVTLKLSGSRLSVNRAVALLKGIGAGDLGRIRLEGDTAAYVDVRPQELERLLEAHIEGMRLSRANDVPAEAQTPGNPRSNRGQRPRAPRGGEQPERGDWHKRESSPETGSRRRVVYR
ncbi:MAG: DEAD/DEAH box helicase [Thermaceae bacterium]|nr:DEAD/DEAH box helicase [Thermaceae bacterium]